MPQKTLGKLAPLALFSPDRIPTSSTMRFYALRAPTPTQTPGS
ncbi:conserved hypothetical protein [Planktothrix agardhii]|nr:conserved hypothetical protein [Planktothrix agardhii]